MPPDTHAPLHPVAARRALRLIALFEAGKGIAAIIAVLGLADLQGDLQQFAEELIGRFGLDSGRYASTLHRYAEMLPSLDIGMLVALAVCYAAIRVTLAFGLWHDKAWAEWLAALSGSIYIPFELHHLLQRTSLATAAILVLNVAVVTFLAAQLWRRRKRAHGMLGDDSLNI